jgi:hypothetical protein
VASQAPQEQICKRQNWIVHQRSLSKFEIKTNCWLIFPHRFPKSTHSRFNNARLTCHHANPPKGLLQIPVSTRTFIPLTRQSTITIIHISELKLHTISILQVKMNLLAIYMYIYIKCLSSRSYHCNHPNKSWQRF